MILIPLWAKMRVTASPQAVKMYFLEILPDTILHQVIIIPWSVIRPEILTDQAVITHLSDMRRPEPSVKLVRA